METDHSCDRFEFTPDQLRVLRNQQGQPLHIPVEETKKLYLVVEEGVIPTLDEQYIRQGLAHAALQAERGHESEWNPEEIKAAGREFLARRNRLS